MMVFPNLHITCIFIDIGGLMKDMFMGIFWLISVNEGFSLLVHSHIIIVIVFFNEDKNVETALSVFLVILGYLKHFKQMNNRHKPFSFHLLIMNIQKNLNI